MNYTGSPTVTLQVTDKEETSVEDTTVNPWMYVSGGLLLLIVVIIVVIVAVKCTGRGERRRRAILNENDDICKGESGKGANPNSYEKMATKEEQPRARAITNVDKFGYSIVEEPEDSKEDSYTGYVEIIEEPNDDGISSQNIQSNSNLYLKPQDSCLNPAKNGQPDKLRQIQHIKKHVSCQDVCNEYDNSDVSTDVIERDLETDVSRFNRYYTSMQLKNEVKSGDEIRRGTLPVNFRVNESKDTKDESNCEVREKRKHGDYDVPPPKLRTVAPTPGKSRIVENKDNDTTNTCERMSKVRFSNEKALIHQISVYESSTDDDSDKGEM